MVNYEESMAKTNNEKPPLKQFLKNNAVLALFFLSSVLVLIVSSYMNIAMTKTVNMMEEALQNHLLAAATAAADHADADELERYYTLEDTRVPEYAELKNWLIEFAEQYHVLYAYYWRDNGDGQLQYIVDNDLDPETMVGPDSFYPIEEFALAALTGTPTATNFDEYTPAWDGLLSAWAPVYNSRGEISCIAGVDISDEQILYQRDLAVSRSIIQIISLVVSIISSIIMFMLYRQKIELLNIFNNNLQEMVEEETQKVLALHETFGRYLSDDIVKDLLESPEGLALGGKKQIITIMMTDIRGFTRFSEQMQVEDAVTMLNHYFSKMVEVIHKYNGTVIEFMGDGILAIFGAPVVYTNHTDSAVACAVEMQLAMEGVNEWNILNDYPKLEMGIGINSGETIVGNIGSPKVMKYNVIGKNVNLASRIESYCTGGQVLLSESSYNSVQAQLQVVRTTEILPKGVQKPVKVYQVNAIGAPFELKLKNRELPLENLQVPLPADCYLITEKHVDDKKLNYYLLSVSAERAIIIPRKGEKSLDVFDNIKLVNKKGSEVFAKVIRKTKKGIILIRFTTEARDFVDALR
jgi:adenylate cyclase